MNENNFYLPKIYCTMKIFNQCSIILLNILFSASVFAQSVPHGISPEWSQETLLPAPLNSTNYRGFLYSNMCVLSNNKRIIFVNKEDNPLGVFYTWSYDGINWAQPVKFEPVSVIGLAEIKVAKDTNDNIHIIWSSNIPKALYYTQMDSALNIVIDSVRIADNPVANKFSDEYLTVDLKNRIHVMWNEGKTANSVMECYYSRSDDGGMTWTPKKIISTTDAFNSAFPRGQFNACNGDTIAIAWRDSVSAYDWDIQMVTSFDAGNTWSAPFTVNSSPDYQGDPDVVIDNQNRIHLFYHHAPVGNMYWGIRVVYGYSDDFGQTWLPSSNFYQNPICLNQRSYLVEGSRYDIKNNILWT
ncbi:MAG: hypothetical protein D6707_01585, partial [Bacteroidetes bacterium]